MRILMYVFLTVKDDHQSSDLKESADIEKPHPRMSLILTTKSYLLVFNFVK